MWKAIVTAMRIADKLLSLVKKPKLPDQSDAIRGYAAGRSAHEAAKGAEKK